MWQRGENIHRSLRILTSIGVLRLFLSLGKAPVMDLWVQITKIVVHCVKSDVQKANPDQNSIVGLGAEVKGQNHVLQLHRVIQKRPNSTSAHFYSADDDQLSLPLLFPALTFS
jgi:hypothetical protein